MRNKQEMMDLILGTGKADDRVRAVIMNGSRANPNVRRDVFQDYDIVYIVTDMDSFLDDHSWIDVFGERMILQMPDDFGDPPVRTEIGYGYLIQFMDGNRIDLTMFPVDRLDEYQHDSLRILLLDKDGLFEPFPPPDETDYLPSPPTAKLYADCCNEFWWVSVYVAKSLWRQQLVSAKHLLDYYVRKELMKMLNWYVGIQTGFSKNLGGYGKFLQPYVEPELWAMLEKTYADADYDSNWDALLVMGDLFRHIAHAVAAHYQYDYQEQDDERVSKFLRYVRELPSDATDMDFS